MKEGDVLEWRTLNKTARGTLERDGEDLIVRTSPDHAFPLENLFGSRSIKIVQP